MISTTILLHGSAARRYPHAHALIDARDYDRVATHRWHLHPNGHGGLYAAATIGGSTAYLHRLIAGALPGKQVDHRNGDTLDCRRANLRIATPGQNQSNRRPNVNGSGVKGVYRRGDRWRAQIGSGGRRVSLGTFDSIEAAGRAYNAAARLHHGEFARLNEVANA